MSLYDDIGYERIAGIVRAFYTKAFDDPMLAHFFMDLDHSRLANLQVEFVCSMLGGPQSYTGRALTPIHDPIAIRPPHFRRRQRILQETMEEFGLTGALQEGWLKAEERLKPLIMKDQAACRD